MLKRTKGGKSMGRKRNPERDASLKRYLDSGGKATLAELAEAAGVSKSRISKWKSEDKWDEQLKGSRRKGGQKGNKNAVGRTPKKDGNKNAVTHGAYAQAKLNDIDQEKAEHIKSIVFGKGQSQLRMTEELQSLLVRKAYLEGLLERYTAQKAEEKYYIDKIVHMVVHKSVKDITEEDESGVKTGEVKDPEGSREKLKTAMKSIIKSSSFDRAMKIEAELNRLHGRIIRQIDSMKSLEMEERRLKLEEQKYKLAKQKLIGEIEIDEDEDGEDEVIESLADGENG